MSPRSINQAKSTKKPVQKTTRKPASAEIQNNNFAVEQKPQSTGQAYDAFRFISNEHLSLTQRQEAALNIGRLHGNNVLQAWLSSRSNAPDVQRGEAGVHQDIEMTAWGVKKPTDPAKMSPEQKAAMEAYIGNWMRDFSQFFVPSAFGEVSKVPKRPGDMGSAPIGAVGAEKVMTGLLQALAAMEFGPAITKAFVTGPLLGAYRPEEHMDNPAGMSLGGDVLVRDKSGALAPGDKVPRPDAEAQIKGSAVPGPQVENKKLFEASGEGLSNHIYNTKEWVKKQFITADAAGAKGGRLHFASGLHGVEDYFAHSNFIEVALNSLLTGGAVSLPDKLKGLDKSGYKPGTPVDTLYDKKTKKGRSVVTTGSFGPMDTKISIAHALLPKMPILFTALDKSLDEALGLLEKEKMTWAAIKAKLDTTPAGSALNFMLDGLESGGVQLPVLQLEKWTIPDLPDVVPDSIEDFLEGRWIIVGYEESYMKPSKAIPSYQQLYQDLKATWEHRDVLSKMLWALLKIPFLDPKTVAAIKKAIAMLKKDMAELTKQFREQLKKQMRLFIMKMIESMIGVSVPAEKRAALEKWMEHIHHGVEGKVAETSLETRLNKGGDLSKLEGSEKKRRIPEGGDLPPSHSEISKDHLARAKKAGHTVHTTEGRSPFYEMHQELAIFADKHLSLLMEEAWVATHKSGSIIPGKPVTMDPKERKALDAEAKKRAKKVKKLSKKEGLSFIQSFASMTPEVKKLLNGVDLYISHPDDGSWWQPVMEKYINAHPEQVLADIEKRNKTRSKRK